MDPVSSGNENDVVFDEVYRLGEGYLKTHADEFAGAMRLVTPQTLANITYTSGTTSDPKGIMLTHSNYVNNVMQSLSLMDIPDTYKTLAFLPWDHCFAHTACLYCFIAKGAGVASLQVGKTANETLKNIPLNIKEIKPDLLMSVPSK
jgi:long-chain acyl-CoA synthetase